MFLEKILRNVSHARQVFMTKGLWNRWSESVILSFGNEMRLIYFETLYVSQHDPKVLDQSCSLG